MSILVLIYFIGTDILVHRQVRILLQKTMSQVKRQMNVDEMADIITTKHYVRR